MVFHRVATVMGKRTVLSARIMSACGVLAVGAALASAAPARAGTLPDGRGYELVSTLTSPLGFGQANPAGGDYPRGVAQVAESGDAIVYTTPGPSPGAASGSLFSWQIARRTSSGWQATPIGPPQGPEAGSLGYPAFAAFSPDLSTAILEQQNPPLVPAAQSDAVYLYSLGIDSGAYSLVSGTPSPFVVDPRIAFEGASSDLSTVAYETDSDDDQAPGFPSATISQGASEIYESVDGHVELAGILPDGNPAPGGASMIPAQNAVSDDGSTVFLSMECETCSFDDLYARIDGDSTVDVSASQRTTPDPSADASPDFAGASADGSTVLFTDQVELTNDANTGDASAGDGDDGNDLYQYDLDTGRLTDLTPDANPADDATGADVQGGIESSQDGSVVSFVADGALAGAAVSGEPNLYVEQGGLIHFVATLASSDLYTPSISADTVPVENTMQMTPDGQFLLFQSAASLTGYDNVDASTGQPDSELYRYDVATGQLSCVSCNPSGAAPDGPSSASPAPHLPGGGNALEPTNITPDGSRVFFESDDALVPQDTNGVSDVYEWEQDGTGTCASNDDAGGCVSLLTPGDEGDPALFIGADASGDDVLVATQQPLTGQGNGGLNELYDVRVGGGFPAPPQTTPPTPCTATACAGQSAVPPAPPTVATAVFSGPGNPRGGPAARAAVLARRVRGDRVAIRVRVGGAGEVTLSGRLVHSVRHRFARRGSATLTVMLSAHAAATLRTRRQGLFVHIRVAFVPRAGRGAERTITVTFKEAGR